MTYFANQAAFPLFNKVMDQARQTAGSLADRLFKKHVPHVDPDLLKNKAQQSSRIQARILARQERFDELIKFAHEANNADIARAIISAIEADCKDHKEELLTPIAKSNSCAALPAMIALHEAGFPDMLTERLANGDIERLVASGIAEAFPVLNLFGKSEDGDDIEALSQAALDYFDNLWEALAHRPEAQLKLLGEILGDGDPGGFRYQWERNEVPEPVKIKALELLSAIRPNDFERYLYYASKDQNISVGFKATLEVMRHWQSDWGRQPKNLEPFALLDINLLFYCCYIASAFSWRGPTGLMEIFKTLCKDRDELEDMDPESNPARFAGLQNRIDRLEEDLVKATEDRINCLQPLMDRFTDVLQLPHARIRATDASFCAAYAIGTGSIEFDRVSLLEDKPMSEEFMSSVLHEINHMEQDVLVIRLLSDEIGLVYGQHAKSLLQLYEMYSSAIGYAPESTFLLEVIRLRADKPLNPAQRRRAERLYEAMTVCRNNNEAARQVGARMDRLGTSIFEIKDGLYDDYLLSCLDAETHLESMFQNGHVPAILLDEITRCRADLEILVNDAFAMAGKSKPPKKNIISIAYSMLTSLDDENVADILARLKAVFLQVLEEEYKSLRRMYSRLMREGYHEEEAYSVSDRLEVMVPALHKGWYKFNM